MNRRAFLKLSGIGLATTGIGVVLGVSDSDAVQDEPGTIYGYSLLGEGSKAAKWVLDTKIGHRSHTVVFAKSCPSCGWMMGIQRDGLCRCCNPACRTPELAYEPGEFRLR